MGMGNVCLQQLYVTYFRWVSHVSQFLYILEMMIYATWEMCANVNHVMKCFFSVISLNEVSFHWKLLVILWVLDSSPWLVFLPLVEICLHLGLHATQLQSILWGVKPAKIDISTTDKCLVQVSYIDMLPLSNYIFQMVLMESRHAVLIPAQC